MVHTDASDHATRETLTQEDPVHGTQVVAYKSKKLTLAEIRYTVNKGELLGLLTALEKFRSYIEGMSFYLHTDNQVVANLLPKPRLNRRETRWAQILANYNMDIVDLRPGRIHVLGDALSRPHSSPATGIAGSRGQRIWHRCHHLTRFVGAI